MVEVSIHLHCMPEMPIFIRSNSSPTHLLYQRNARYFRWWEQHAKRVYSPVHQLKLSWDIPYPLETQLHFFNHFTPRHCP